MSAYTQLIVTFEGSNPTYAVKHACCPIFNFNQPFATFDEAVQGLNVSQHAIAIYKGIYECGTDAYDKNLNNLLHTRLQSNNIECEIPLWLFAIYCENNKVVNRAIALGLVDINKQFMAIGCDKILTAYTLSIACPEMRNLLCNYQTPNPKLLNVETEYFTNTLLVTKKTTKPKKKIIL